MRKETSEVKMEPRPRCGSHRLDTGRARSVCDGRERRFLRYYEQDSATPSPFCLLLDWRKQKERGNFAITHGPLFSFTFLLAITG